MTTAQEWIDRLKLERHPEGGWYREWYRSALSIPVKALGARGDGVRAAATSIYYLLEPGDFSAFHRIRSDEIWHHLGGDPLQVEQIGRDGCAQSLLLGGDVGVPAGVVLAGTWFGARPVGPGYALVGCTVSPGFEFEDFEMAERERLIQVYPQHEELIAGLTRT